MVEELDRLDKHARNAIKWIAAEFKYTNDLHEFLEKVKNEGAEEALRDVKKAFRALRYVGRAERRADRSETAVLEDLKALEEILPQNLKHVDEKLIEELDIGKKKLIELASIFTGKLRGELKDIREEESVLEHYEKKDNIPEAKLEAIKRELTQLVDEAEGEVEELIKWIGETEAVLEKIEKGFVAKLKGMSS